MIRVFCDFDGTIAKEDVGSRLFQTFAGDRAHDIVQEYLNDRITARECLVRECQAVEELTEDRLSEFVDSCELDPHFAPFVGFCRQHGVPVTVVSDGLDYYVSRLLSANGLSDVTFFANHLELVMREGRLKMEPSFPYTDSECIRCANCKRNHLLTLSADEDLIVYVGDGISDRCPVRYADVVFAKKALIRYCQQQNITYHEYRHFGDVQARIAELVRRKRVKQRREAVMARREVFMQG